MNSIEVCGRNTNFNIGEKSNHKAHDGEKYIYPATKTNSDPSTLSSYSVYNKTVEITKEGVAFAMGDNTKSQISGSLPKTILKTLTKIDLRDSHGHICSAVSAICGNDYTLYITSTNDEDSEKQLAYAHANLNREFPVILSIGEVTPASLYGGYSDCAAVTTAGSIIYIHESFYNSPSNKIDAVLLPENQKAVSIACCYNFVIVLAVNGRVYASKKEPILLFTEVPELKDIDIVSISGVSQHCFAVSRDGQVFVRGDDFIHSGCLGLGKDVTSPEEFKEIKSLSKYKIVKAYAGTNHSLFQTQDGILLGCGDNRFGQLLLSVGPCKEKTYRPIETNVTDATFCIAGDYNTAVFRNFVPPMTPNKEIK